MKRTFVQTPSPALARFARPLLRTHRRALRCHGHLFLCSTMSRLRRRLFRDDDSEAASGGLPRPVPIDDNDADDDREPMVLSPFTGGALSVSYYRGTPRLTAMHTRTPDSDTILHSVERSPHGFVVHRDGNSPSPLHISRVSLTDPDDVDIEYLLYSADNAPSGETVRLVRTPDYDTYDNEARWRSASRAIGEAEGRADGDDGAAFPVLIAFVGEDAHARGRKTRWFTRNNALHAARFVGLLRHEPILIVDVFVRDVARDASSGAPYHITVAYLASGLQTAMENDESASVAAILYAALDEARLGMDVATIRPRQAAYESAMHPVGVKKDKSKSRHALDAVFGELKSTPGVLPRLFNCFTLSVHRSERNKENDGRAPANSQRIFERAWVSLPNRRDTAHFLVPLSIEQIPAFIRTTLASDSVVAADKAVGGFAAAWVNLTQLDGDLRDTLTPRARLTSSGVPTLVALYRAAAGGGLAYTPEEERTAQLEYALRAYFGTMNPDTLAWEGEAAPRAADAFVKDVWEPACRAILQGLSVATPPLMAKGYNAVRAFGIARGDSRRELRDKASAYTKAVIQRTAFSRRGVEGVAAAGRTRGSTFQFERTTSVPTTLLSGTMLSEPFPAGIYPSIVSAGSNVRRAAAASFAATNSVLNTGTGIRCGTKPVVAIAQELTVTERANVDHMRRQDVDVDDAATAYVRLWLDTYKTFFAYEESRDLGQLHRHAIVLPTANALPAMDQTFSTWRAPQTMPAARLLVDVCLAHADTRLALPWERPEWTQAVKYYGFRDMGIPALFEAAPRPRGRRTPAREGAAMRML